jgi:hypothetical protein
MTSDSEQQQTKDPRSARLDAAYSFRWAEAMEALESALTILEVDDVSGPTGIARSA